MIPLETVLLRLGDGIEKLFRKDEWFLVKALERESMRDQQKLVDIVLEMNTKWDILRDKEKRNVIIRRLEKDEAMQLTALLGNIPDGFPYKALQEMRMNKNSQREQEFFAYFGFQAPQKEKEIEQEGLTLRKLSVGTGINASITYNF